MTDFFYYFFISTLGRFYRANKKMCHIHFIELDVTAILVRFVFFFSLSENNPSVSRVLRDDL